MTRACVTAAVCLAAALLSACGGSGGKEQRAGAAVWEKSGCGDCHTLEAARSKGKSGPNLDDLKPDLLRVAAQVKNGGNGMPSFSGQLSSEEIQQVSSFVAEATGKGTGKVAKFEPDDKTIDSCRQSGDFACFEQAFGNETYRKGPKEALALLAQTQTELQPVNANCHRIVHTMGAAALAKYKGNVAEAFVGGNAVCWSGYYHGIVEQAFYNVQRKDIAQKSREICADEKLRAQTFLFYQCVHGLGHGLMLYTAYELPESLKVCDALTTDWDRRSCAGGVFMENFSTSRGAKSTYIKDDDLMYPCNSVAEKHKYYCYLMITSRILPTNGYDFKATAKECLKAERDWIDECYQSFGRDASGTAIKDARKALELCSYSGRYQGDCLYAVARDITSNDASPDRAFSFCARPAARYRARCFEGVGTIIGSLHPAVEERRATCRDGGRRYYEDCVRGAGAA